MRDVEVRFSDGPPITDFVHPCGHTVSYRDGQFIFYDDTPAKRVYDAMVGAKSCECDVFRRELTWALNSLRTYRGRLPPVHSITVGQLGFDGGLYVAMME